MTGRPLLLDLFCGAGGASEGYSRAGFDVIGVDNAPMPHYPFTFIQADALNMLDTLILGGTTNHARVDYVVGWGYRLASFAAIHASPPCQRYSVSTAPYRNQGKAYPDLVGQVRQRLELAGLPWVIENVPGSPLVAPVVLCGSHFGLTAELAGLGAVGLQRHRLFESSFPVPDPGPHDHRLPAITVAGHDVPSHQRALVKVPVRVRRALMGIDWMNRDELGQAIPPAYSEYVGKFLAAECIR